MVVFHLRFWHPLKVEAPDPTEQIIPDQSDALRHGRVIRIPPDGEIESVIHTIEIIAGCPDSAAVGDPDNMIVPTGRSVLKMVVGQYNRSVSERLKAI